MNKRNILGLLRIALGWVFFYAGLSKIMNSSWTAAGFLNGAKTFPGLYHWFALPANIGWVNVLNEYGLALVGLGLILGLKVRWVSLAGILLMVLYYFPQLSFPYAGSTSAYIIDEHVVYGLILGYYWVGGDQGSWRLKLWQ